MNAEHNQGIFVSQGVPSLQGRGNAFQTLLPLLSSSLGGEEGTTHGLRGMEMSSLLRARMHSVLSRGQAQQSSSVSVYDLLCWQVVQQQT